MTKPVVMDILPEFLEEARQESEQGDGAGISAEADMTTTAILLQMQELSSLMKEELPPVAILLLVSGGDDSIAMAARCYPWLSSCWSCLQFLPADVRVVHIDTGIGLPETRQYVERLAAVQGWKLEIRKTPASYDQIVRQHGFPGPSSHRYMYIQLKERPLQALIRDYRPQMGAWKRWFVEQLQQAAHFPLWYQRGLFQILANVAEYLEQEQRRPVVLLTGVRQQESSRRMGHVRAFQRMGRQIWVAPLLRWSKTDVLAWLEYERKSQGGLFWRNPASIMIHKSGECLCGAYARPGELEEICFWFPETGRRLRELERIVRGEGFPWGWEEGPPEWWQQAKEGQAFLPGFEPEPGWLCSSCVAERANREEREA